MHSTARATYVREVSLSRSVVDHFTVSREPTLWIALANFIPARSQSWQISATGEKLGDPEPMWTCRWLGIIGAGTGWLGIIGAGIGAMLYWLGRCGIGRVSYQEPICRCGPC